jgi:hypothetical protein
MDVVFDSGNKFLLLKEEIIHNSNNNDNDNVVTVINTNLAVHGLTFADDKWNHILISPNQLALFNTYLLGEFIGWKVMSFQ